MWPGIVSRLDLDGNPWHSAMDNSGTWRRVVRRKLPVMPRRAEGEEARRSRFRGSPGNMPGICRGRSMTRWMGDALLLAKSHGKRFAPLGFEEVLGLTDYLARLEW